jgi:peptidoglycan/LPS O-acetylase OafA/YrhL
VSLKDLSATLPTSHKNNALEGLRGIAAIVVVLSHCVFTFFPYLQNCNPELLKQSWESIAIQLPRTAFNGSFAVCIFFVMSGFVLAKAFFSGHSYSLERAATKRYIRLAMPVAASIFICCTMMYAGLLKLTVTDLPGFIGQAYQGNPSYVEAAKDSIWRSLLNGAQTYNYVLWTIRVEFLGSMLLFAFLALFGKARFGAMYAILITCAIATIDPLNAPLYGLFFVGAYMNKVGDIGRNKVTHAVALIGGLFLGGSQSCTPIYGFLVKIAQLKLFKILPPEIWAYFSCGSGAILVVWVAVGDNALSRMLSTKPLAWLGHKSFSVYLLHSVILSSVGMYVYTATAAMSLPVRAALSTLCVILVSVAVAIPFARLVDDQAVRLANQFARFSFGRLKAASQTAEYSASKSA